MVSGQWSETEGKMDYRLIQGDCLDALRGLPDASVDAVVTDPPAGISFMGKEWDHDQGGRGRWVEWMTARMAEALRVTKPGGHALVWALPRTSHWTMCALEDAGWEIRDVVTHLFGSGFPKSHDIGKAIDKAAGAEREMIAPLVAPAGNKGRTVALGGSWQESPMLTAPATDAAKQWNGWGTALKPAAEYWILCRKPLAEPTIAAQVLATGTGALNVDACRVTTVENLGRSNHVGPYSSERTWSVSPTKGIDNTDNPPSGRWPSNLVLSHAPGCVRTGVKRVKASSGEGSTSPKFTGMNKWQDERRPIQHYADADGLETVDAWTCVDGCPVKALDEQAGERKSGKPTGKRNATTGFSTGITPGTHDLTGYGDTGGASRFFPVFAYEDADFVPWLYCAKASRRERNEGCENLPLKPGGSNVKGYTLDIARGLDRNRPTTNSHPTVKPLALCSWLVRLITPPGGIVLDPFMGSGSIGCAALREGCGYIGVEREAEYIEIARARLDWTAQQAQQMRLAV